MQETLHMHGHTQTASVVKPCPHDADRSPGVCVGKDKPENSECKAWHVLGPWGTFHGLIWVSKSGSCRQLVCVWALLLPPPSPRPWTPLLPVA